jgi:hypothetical protein
VLTSAGPAYAAVVLYVPEPEGVAALVHPEPVVALGLAFE